MKNLFLIGGAPGSGKTTAAAAILNIGVGNAAVHNQYGIEGRAVSADDYFTGTDGKYRFDSSKLAEAHGWCLVEARNAMEDGFETVIVHNTLTNKGERGIAPYKKLAEIHGYKVHYLLAVNHHGSPSDHDVPTNTVLRFGEECARTLFESVVDSVKEPDEKKVTDEEFEKARNSIPDDKLKIGLERAWRRINHHIKKKDFQL